MTLNRKRENNNFGKPDAGLPTVNTCKHYVKMPEYTSYEQLKERFNLATKEDDHHFDLNWARAGNTHSEKSHRENSLYEDKITIPYR